MITELYLNASVTFARAIAGLYFHSSGTFDPGIEICRSSYVVHLVNIRSIFQQESDKAWVAGFRGNDERSLKSFRISVDVSSQLN